MGNGHMKARALFPNLGPCEGCGGSATERHHRDGNQFNNDAANIAFVCRGCHMEIDGRIDSMRRAPKPCSDCGVLAKPLSRGRCRRCYWTWRRREIAADRWPA